MLLILVVSPGLRTREAVIALLVLNGLHLAVLLLALAAPSSSVLSFVHTLLLLLILKISTYEYRSEIFWR